jgi:hypothetical protein
VHPMQVKAAIAASFTLRVRAPINGREARSWKVRSQMRKGGQQLALLPTFHFRDSQVLSALMSDWQSGEDGMVTITFQRRHVKNLGPLRKAPHT